MTDTDTPPTLDNSGNLSNSPGDAVVLQLNASDADGNPLTVWSALMEEKLHEWTFPRSL